MDEKSPIKDTSLRDPKMPSSDFGRNDAAGLISRDASNLEASHEYHEDNELYRSTTVDARDMRRMGKAQEFVRHYRLVSMISFAGLAAPAWELALFQLTPGLINGGLPMLIYSNVWCFVFFFPVVLSLAEMASMAPIAGAQFHWVSEFAPAKYQKLLSYLTGWTSTLSYQAGNATGFILIGTLIQSVILLNNPDYSFPNWQATLLAIAAVVFVILCNYFGSRLVPHCQIPAFAIHILAYLAFLVPVWRNAPKASSKQAWTDVQNLGGWSSLPLSVMIGQFPAIAAQTTVDTALHMSEEVQDASKSIPRVLLSIYLINFVLNLTTLLTLCYHLPSVDDALNDITTYPAVYVIRQAMSTTWVSVLLAVIAALILVASVPFFVAVSRQLYAFARDRGVPFSRWISAVDQRRQIPANSYFLSGVISVLLSLIYIGSPTAYYAMTSLTIVALLQCYIFSICCVLWRRIYHPKTLPYAQFSLGRWGVPINILAIIFALWCFFWCFWPLEYPVTAEGFNWSSVIFGGVVILSIICYLIAGRRMYAEPVASVEGRGAGVS